MDFDDFDDFNDGFDDGDFMDDSDGDFGMDDPSDEDSGIEEEPTGDHKCDDEITVEDAVFLGGTMMGWAYEEGIEEGKRRKLEKKMNDDRNNRNRKGDKENEL
jgi:hypothetical protein